MKIIDNRYKIENMIDSNVYFESYKVTDLWGNDKSYFMKLYHYDIQSDLIEYLIDEFIKFANIRHENILKSEKFSIVRTIDTKNTNMLLYYSISEYTDSPTLEYVKKDLKLKDKLEILAQIILALDFLHFKGITYKFLNPSQMFIYEKNKVKLQSLSTIAEKVENSRYTDFEKEFISTEFTMDNVREHKTMDYYSLGTLINYLFLDEESLSQEEGKILLNISKELIKKDYEKSSLNSIDILDRIIMGFELDFTYDLIKYRDKLFFHNRAVGRDKEISQMMEIDKNIYNGVNNYKGIIVRGDSGIGKSKLLGELSYKLEMKGRDVYSISIKENKYNDLLDMSNLLKQSIKDTPSDLIDKYRDELSKILPELSLYVGENNELDLSLKTEKYRIYNRISNYFKELSKGRIIYIIVDDLQNCNPNFLELLNYLLNNLGSSNIFFIFAYEDKMGENPNLVNAIKSLLSDSSLMDMKVHSLDLNEIGEIIRDILGMGRVPINFSSTLFKETQGNPRHIESLIKHLYNIGQLYMNPRGNWHITVDDYSNLHIPTNINETMLKQLSVIKENYYEIFKLMSIFDDFLHKNILLKMLDMEVNELEIQLEKLIRLKLIDENLVDWGYSYSISNVEIKSLIYFELSEEEKIDLHKTAAETILELKGENLDFIFEELIYHLMKSQQSERALDIVLEKIESLDNEYGYQGIYLLEKAYTIAKEKDNIVKLEILGDLTKKYFIKGKLEDTDPHLLEYEKLSRKLNNSNHLIKAKTIFANIYNIKNQSDLYNEQISEIEKISKENNIIEGDIVSLSLKARYNIQKGNFKKAENQLIKSIKISEENEIDDHMGILYNRLGVVKFLIGDIKNAISYFQKSIDFYNKVGNSIDTVRGINNIGNIYMAYYGNTVKAKKYYKKGLEIASKYEVKEVQAIFLQNLSNTSIMDYEYDKALDYILESRQVSTELQDSNGLFVCYVNLGKIYLFTGKIDKAYEKYLYVKEIFKSGSITNIESVTDYHDFLVHFYLFLGKWDSAKEHCIILEDIHRDRNEKEYLKSQYRLLYIRIIKDKIFNKDEITNILNKYKGSEYLQDSREAFLVLATVSMFQREVEFTFEILEEDKKMKSKLPSEFLNTVRDSIISCLNPMEDGVNRLISIEEDLGDNYRYPINLLINFAVASKFILKNNHRDSIKYLIESLDIIYRDMLKIPDLSLRMSFVKSRQTDFIKANLVRAISKTYGEVLEYKNLKNINESQLNDYFDITPIVDVLGNEEFSKLTQLDSYGEALNIKNIEELISKLTDDYKYNLELILKYISKESLANIGYIVKLDEFTQKYKIIASLDGRDNYDINENILKLSDRTEDGLIINNDMSNLANQEYREFLSENIRGIICLPILVRNQGAIYLDNRRKNQSEKSNIGYIYMETDRVFNRFNHEKLMSISKLTYLVHINLENNRLRVEATTDRLTGAYTRKYLDIAFKELINNTKINEGSFSILMLDIDRFKNVNDTHGHRKGDEVLQEIGAILKSMVRSTDIVARYGGEEFTILVKDVGEKEARSIAEKIRLAIYSLKVKGVNNPISISIGVSMFPLHSQFKEELMEKADQALYTAKETGRNKVCFWDYSMTNSSNRADKLAGILTGSTESDNRNILAVIDIIDLIKESKDLKYKSFEFLGRLLDVVEAEHATLMVIDGDKTDYYTRIRFNDDWVETPLLNKKVIDRVTKERKGEFLIDWDNLDDTDSLSGLPNWESLIVHPLIKEEELKGIIYLSAPLKTKEFDFNSYNLSKCYANVFAAIL